MIDREALRDKYFWLYPPPCVVRILIVGDTGITFDNAGFGLREVINTLSASPRWVRFVITTANRRADATADLQNFQFDSHDLAQYDEIWLFGYESGGAIGALSANEVRRIAEFMDGGGGVFATGDHENLGEDLCAQIPRVRSMRRWYYGGGSGAPGPNGEPEAPDVLGPRQHDTVVDLDFAMPGLQGDQSDQVPQEIRPRFYTRTNPLVRKRYPHPLLCGPQGVIRYLPDHMHEGMCEVPTDLGRSYNYAGYSCVEYPSLGGHQERPEVIAWATSTIQPHDFGVVAAYNGHSANVGRVAVDATWHHFFYINLMGFVGATDPVVRSRYSQIKAYFCNLAVWLAPVARQQSMRTRAMWMARWYYTLLIVQRPVNQVYPFERLTLLGTEARDALGLLASQCQTMEWLDWYFERLRVPWEIAPWRRPPFPDPPPFFIDPDIAVTAALGGVMARLSDELPVGSIERDGKEIEVDDERIDAAVAEGVEAGVGAFHAELTASMERFGAQRKGGATPPGATGRRRPHGERRPSRPAPTDPSPNRGRTSDG